MMETCHKELDFGVWDCHSQSGASLFSGDSLNSTLEYEFSLYQKCLALCLAPLVLGCLPNIRCPFFLTHGTLYSAFPAYLATRGDHVTRAGRSQAIWHSSLLFLPTLKRFLIFETAATVFPQRKAKRTSEMPVLTLLTPAPAHFQIFCETKKPLFAQVPASQVFCCLRPCLHFLQLSLLCVGGVHLGDSWCWRASLLIQTFVRS